MAPVFLFSTILRAHLRYSSHSSSTCLLSIDTKWIRTGWNCWGSAKLAAVSPPLRRGPTIGALEGRRFVKWSDECLSSRKTLEISLSQYRTSYATLPGKYRITYATLNTRRTYVRRWRGEANSRERERERETSNFTCRSTVKYAARRGIKAAKRSRFRPLEELLAPKCIYHRCKFRPSRNGDAISRGAARRHRHGHRRVSEERGTKKSIARGSRLLGGAAPRRAARAGHTSPSASARLGDPRPRSGGRPARAPCPTRRSLRSVLVVQSSRPYPFHGRPRAESHPRARYRSLCRLRAISYEAARSLAFESRGFDGFSHGLGSPGGGGSEILQRLPFGGLGKTVWVTRNLRPNRRRENDVGSNDLENAPGRALRFNKLRRTSAASSSHRSLRRRRRSVPLLLRECVRASVCVRDREGLIAGDDPAGSREPPLPTMVIEEAASVKRTVVIAFDGNVVCRDCHLRGSPAR